jgi:hypothetical protein
MSDNAKKPPRRKPGSTAETATEVSKSRSKPYRMTLEELLAGMTPDEKPLFEDDWPMGEELI